MLYSDTHKLPDAHHLRDGTEIISGSQDVNAVERALQPHHFDQVPLFVQRGDCPVIGNGSVPERASLKQFSQPLPGG
jgi:hypothetical protein